MFAKNTKQQTQLSNMQWQPRGSGHLMLKMTVGLSLLQVGSATRGGRLFELTRLGHVVAKSQPHNFTVAQMIMRQFVR